MSELYPFHLIDRKPNFYGFSGLRRSAHVREEADWLVKLENQGDVKFLLSWRSRSLINIEKAEEPTAVILSSGEVQKVINNADNIVFLGTKNGFSYVGVDVSSIEELQLHSIVPCSGAFRDLREVGPLLERFEGSMLAYNRALLFWHQKNKYCGSCGGITYISKAGHQINCSSAKCAQIIFPRTDPAVIMLVHDGKRALLGRQKTWKPGMYSTLAGFLEPGETLEEAVAREVWEEANINVTDVRYHSSQPWPFPASIMLGFYAKAQTTYIRRNDNEVEDVQWFNIDQLLNFTTFGKSLPRRDSIARRLIEDWIDGQV